MKVNSKKKNIVNNKSEVLKKSKKIKNDNLSSLSITSDDSNDIKTSNKTQKNKFNKLNELDNLSTLLTTIFDSINSTDINKNDINKNNINKNDINKIDTNPFYSDFIIPKKNGINFFPSFSFEIMQHVVDIYSSKGDVKSLELWLKNSLKNNVFDETLQKYYTESALSNASTNGHINVLDWWLNAYKEKNIILKYNELSLVGACGNGNINVLDWWFNSGLKLKYDVRAIDNASNNNKKEVLDWWYKKYKEDKLQFLYSENSLDNITFNDDNLLSLLEWWKEYINTENKKKSQSTKLKLKYTNNFHYIIKTNNYKKSIEYITKYKLIPSNILNKDVNNILNKDVKNILNQDINNILNQDINDEKKINKNIPEDSKKMNFINLFDILGSGKKDIKNKKDLSHLPQEIQEHIKEKEEELNNNIMINGKTKEYIDNIMKIPFGKYRQEKIFKFMNDLISKINKELKLELKNESDLKEKIFKMKPKNGSLLYKYKILYEEYCKLRIKYLDYVDSTLEMLIYGHNRTKLQLKCIITQWLSGIKTGIVLGIQGPPGVGKTTLIKGALSQCLVDFIDYELEKDCYIRLKNFDRTNEKILNEEKRPFCFISLGGSTNSSTLIGHNITYHGATSGDIVKCLKEAKCMNPILYFDELDKTSKTEHGNEIASVLTHITDPIQNEHFTDRYFSEVKIDLSKCIIVFSYNDPSKIDRILYDRINEIKLYAIPVNDKIEICNKFLLPEILNNVGYNSKDLIINNNDLENLILEYTYEAGVRKLKEKLQEIIRKYNYNDIILNKNISNIYKTNINIKKEYIDKLLHEHHKINLKKISEEPKIGCIHGMYATSNGIGDVMLIQVKKIYNKDILGLQTTGCLEKVISESMGVAKTVAWNLLNNKEQQKILKKFVNTGLHIHCPDGSTSKDGPSAGTAITCAIYSLLTNKVIPNNIAITGEIDLDGNVTAIGGLDAKLSGAKKAGIKLVLVPKDNERDIEILKEKLPYLFDNSFELKFVNKIDNVLKIVFQE
jgi:hypothetical protein